MSRLFQEQQGEPVGEWLRKERVRLGAELLAESPLPIKEIAVRTGFGSVHYFTRVFTKQMGMAPAAFRGRGKRR
ncbi:helix-turn-helix transcriptional regulator [Gordoniibacillus kamchatkensis]|uniref:helix-turn-helix transcriptional regulator n=1 Tax=Gordoniibacillus kamchatkensis TaxID=1590651 RepID=UPI000A783CE9|nr:helix-turn-helix transcriptional regulator [Paenibacillus sp. VKM B-2647]